MKYVGQSMRHSLFSLMYLHVCPSLDGKATSQYLLTASQEPHWRNLTEAPPAKFIWGHRVGRDICVQTTDSVAFYLWTPGHKSQPSPQAKTIISTKSFFAYITMPLQSLANSEALMRNGSQETQARLKVGWGGGRMRGT